MHTVCRSVVDAEQMLAAKDSLLRRWKQEAQLVSSRTVLPGTQQTCLL
jgi:hypothetical protein